MSLQNSPGRFRQTKYAAAYCRISSYLQTMTAKGYNPARCYSNGFLRRMSHGRGMSSY